MMAGHAATGKKNRHRNGVAMTAQNAQTFPGHAAVDVPLEFMLDEI